MIAALFHDAGKFSGGKYHSDETIEEEESARIAERILRRFGMNAASIRKVLAGLRALYNEKSRGNAVAAILHDADFLSKFGALGIAGFFTKSALRGRCQPWPRGDSWGRLSGCPRRSRRPPPRGRARPIQNRHRPGRSHALAAPVSTF